MGVTVTIDSRITAESLEKKALERCVPQLLQRMAEQGQKAWEYCVGRTEEESWHNQTGNLRSSIGWGTFSYGKAVDSGGFQVVLQGGEGAALGRRVLQEQGGRLADNPAALVFVIGERYAVWLEDVRGLDVYSSTQRMLEDSISQIVTEVNEGLG